MALSFRLTGTPLSTNLKQSRLAIQRVEFCYAAKPKSDSHGLKRCLRCNIFYRDEDNSSTACSFHGHVTGEKGLFSLAPPHQGIDGEWTDRRKEQEVLTGVVVLSMTRTRLPCQRGWHVSYDDDGFTLY